MNKQKFLKSLRANLSYLPKREADERLTFYSEMIDDRIEEGLSEEDAVSAIGSIDEIASQCSYDADGSALLSPRARDKKASGTEIALLVLGAPIWIPLLLTVFVVVLSLYIVLWSLMLSLWAIELPFLICAFVSKALLIACKKATLASLLLTKAGASFTAKLFVKRSERQ